MMKGLLAFALGLCLSASPALAGLAIINGGGTGGLIANGTCNSGSSCPTTTTLVTAASTVDVPVGSFVFMMTVIRANSAGVTGCVDSAGNSYSSGSNKTTTGAQSLNWNYGITTIDAPSGTTWTCTTVSTASRGLMVAAFSGAAASPHDASSATPLNGTGTVMPVSPITTGTLSCPGGGANCEVLIAPWTNHNMGAQSAQTAGFTQFGCVTANSSNGCLAYEIVSATTAQSYTSTNANSDVWAMALEGFTAATGGGSGKVCSIGAVGAGTC